jgi:hypothetical protein
MKNSNCIVITTINNPTKQILAYSRLKNWDLIIVGDSKTNNLEYKNLRCIYLGLDEQEKMFQSFYRFVPFHSYTRKMFGYLYAFKNKYNVIYDTDDDNLYNDHNINWQTNRKSVGCFDDGLTNIYRAYTDSNIWPRGIPPTHSSVYTKPTLSDRIPELNVSIVQGLVDNHPDVDAYYRLYVNNNPFSFDNRDFDIILNKYAVCPFNSQNTFWIDKSVFYTMYLPITVTFRYTDILRSIVSLYQLWKNDKTIKFTNASAVQERNKHDLQKDLESEQSMYDTVEEVLNLLRKDNNASILDMYYILYNNNIVKKEELELLPVWLNLVSSYI